MVEARLRPTRYQSHDRSLFASTIPQRGSGAEQPRKAQIVGEPVAPLSHHEISDLTIRTELFEPTVLFRQKRDHWAATGTPRLEDTATARANELMAATVDPGLDDDQLKALTAMADGFVEQVGG